MLHPLASYFQNFHLPQPASHKGQNGKVLLIGGSELFHAASKWSLDVLSKCVDMVFYASVPSNNHLIEEAKAHFWNGIVISREEIENYVSEADVILIGPGMTRERHVSEEWIAQPTPDFDWNHDTYAVTNYLLGKYPDKKWVIDAGALQMVNPKLLNEQMIITPHRRELEQVLDHAAEVGIDVQKFTSLEWLDALVKQTGEEGAMQFALNLSQKLGGVTLLIKGAQDVVASSERLEVITGGNAGMTKGGTGDVLAGLVAALYPHHSAFDAAVMASYVNKRAGDRLFQEVGPFFNASDLVREIPRVLWEEINVKHVGRE